MLVFSRNPGEKIMIGEDIEVTVSSINASRVLFKVDAPQRIIMRKENMSQRKTTTHDTAQPAATDFNFASKCDKIGTVAISRKEGESICVGDSVEIKLSKIRGQTVQIGIEAPGLNIDRWEIFDKKRRKNAVSASQPQLDI